MIEKDNVPFIGRDKWLEFPLYGRQLLPTKLVHVIS